MTKRFTWSAVAAGAAALLLTSAASAQENLKKLPIVVFGPPSLGAFLPPVIKAREYDKAHGLDIEFVERTPDAYAAQFNSGEFKVGGSAALLTVGLAELRGVKAAYLFNLFDYWGAAVTTRDEVQSLSDLEGKNLAAATVTTNFVMFKWLAESQGVDTSKISMINSATPGLVGYAMADRAAAVQLWEPGYTSLTSKNPNIRTLDLKIKETWNAFGGSDSIPYLGVAAHLDWIAENEDTVDALYAAYSDAAEWVAANPEEAAAIIAGDGTDELKANYADLIGANDRLGLNVKWAGDIQDDIRRVYEIGTSIDYFPEMPTNETIYGAGKQ